MTGGKAGSATVASGKGIWRLESGKSTGVGDGGPSRENTKAASKSAGFSMARGESAISGPANVFCDTVGRVNSVSTLDCGATDPAEIGFSAGSGVAGNSARRTGTGAGQPQSSGTTVSTWASWPE